MDTQTRRDAVQIFSCRQLNASSFLRPLLIPESLLIVETYNVHEPIDCYISCYLFNDVISLRVLLFWGPVDCFLTNLIESLCGDDVRAESPFWEQLEWSCIQMSTSNRKNISGALGSSTHLLINTQAHTKGHTYKRTHTERERECLCVSVCAWGSERKREKERKREDRGKHNHTDILVSASICHQNTTFSIFQRWQGRG